jgi:hypothetical protein
MAEPAVIQLDEWSAATKELFGVPVRFRKRYRLTDAGLEWTYAELYVPLIGSSDEQPQE